MQAVVLAGGLGTRLGRLTKERPKSMLLIHGKPFLEYLITLLKTKGIVDFVLCTGYKHEIISGYFGDGIKFGVNIQYSVEKEPLGTGGALKNALPLLDENFLLLNGDTILFFDFDKFKKFHEEHNTCTMLTTLTNDNSRYGQVMTDNNSLVISFREKNSKHDEFLINGGIYLIAKRSFSWEMLPKTFSIENYLFPKLVDQKKLYSFVSRGYFCDIGIESDLIRFKNEVPELNIL
ncbi:MAG: nucleotidyltransferase family protein [Nitrosotalea sp.]